MYQTEKTLFYKLIIKDVRFYFFVLFQVAKEINGLPQMFGKLIF